MGVVRTAGPEVQFSTIDAGGFEILRALASAAKTVGDLTITAGTNGIHSGPSDPHFAGRAYDVRSHDFLGEMKLLVLSRIMSELGTPVVGSGGLVTEFFFGWLEDAGSPGEHIHVQQRRGVEYP